MQTVVNMKRNDQPTVPQSSRIYKVQVLERTLAILDVLSERGFATVPELSARLGLNKTTVYRLLMVLDRHAVVSRGTDRQRYYLGAKLRVYGDKVSGASFQEQAG